MRKIAAILTSFLLLFVFTMAVKASSHRTFKLPPQAKEIAPGVFDLGFVPVDGRLAQGIAYIDYKDGKSHKDNYGKGNGKGAGGGGGSKKEEKTCYAYIANGARWKTTKPYVLDPTLNPAKNHKLTEDYIVDNTNLSLNITWDNEVAFDIFGERDTTKTVDVNKEGNKVATLNGKNEIFFADIENSNAIAVTVVWGYFSGPPFVREIIEHDVVFDDFDYLWGDATNNPQEDVMDYLNIATHEFGHSAGLGHPDDSCTEETMFRYAAYNETKKRDLNSGDITGIKNLYK